MSLEQAINEHAAAIRELASAIVHLAGASSISTTVAHGTTGKAPPVEEKPTPTTAKEAIDQATAAAQRTAAAKKAAADKAAADKVAADKAAEEELAGSGGGAAAELDYAKDVEEKFKAFLKAKGREAGLALLGKYKAKSGSQVAQMDLAAFLADIEAAG